MGHTETDFYFEMKILTRALYVMHWRLVLVPQKSQCIVVKCLCAKMK